MIPNKKSKKIPLNEFNIINKFLKKLNFNKKTVFNFENDGASITIPKGKELVISNDTLIENVHFFKNDSPKSIALKSIRTNLSDIMSMGAIPISYSMSLSLSKNIDNLWLRKFSNALYQEQKKYKIYLIGGDIVASKVLSISITIFGLTNKNKNILRSGAKINDDIWITGNIGDSHLGFKILKKKETISNKKIKNYFINSYYFPKPPVIIGNKLNKIMTSAIDISDGFLGDLDKISINFNKGSTIFADKIPLSRKLKMLINKKKLDYKDILSGGDDYQLLFTSSPINERKIRRFSKLYDVKITKIGFIDSSKKLKFIGYKLKGIKKSYTHKI